MPALPAADVAAGAVLALGAGMLSFSARSLYRRVKPRGRDGAAETERYDAVDELDAARREHALTRLENRILREFIAQRRPEQAIGLLLRRFVPQTEVGFAALIERSAAGPVCEFSRGLSPESLSTLTLSEADLDAVHKERLVTLEGRAAADGSVLAGLAPRDAAKATRLHLVAVGEADDPIGAFATTSLYPAEAALEAQVSLATRLMAGLAASLNAERTLREREAELRLTSEMLDLRAVADGRFDNPVAMIEAFLAALRPRVGADGAALFLFSPRGGTAGRAVARCGGPDEPLLSGCWRDHEETLARFAVAVDRPRHVGPAELIHYGIDALMRSVLLLPLRRDEASPVGVICLSRRKAKPFSSENQALAVWAAEFLTHAIPRVLTQAVVERQARQDGLTGLANRREWDARYPAIVEAAGRSGGEVSLLLCDLDRFKAVNDTYGHRTGDEALRVAARTVQDQVFRTRSSDWALIARYGGEEIAVLLPGFGAAGAQRVAESIRTAIERTVVSVDGRSLRTTISIGTATCPDHAVSPERLFARADAALYRAKADGRNRVCSADDLEPSLPEAVAR